MTIPHPSQSTVTGLDLAIAGLYLVISVVAGVSFAGKQKDLKTFLLAGNRMHSVMIGISVVAALFSGISFLGAPSETFHHNLIILWSVAASFVATPITSKIFLPIFFRLKLYTAYQYLELRFDRRLRYVASASFISRVFLWLSLALYAPSLVISEMLGIPLWSAVILTGVCTTAYTAAGGMKAVIYTDVIQFCVLLLGIIWILVIALHDIPGGLVGAWQIAEAGGKTRIIDLSFSLHTRMTVWGAFFGGLAVNLSALVTDQILVQRYMTAASLKESQRALWIKLALVVPVVGLFYFAGLTLYGAYQMHPELAATLTSSDRLLPNFVVHRLASPIPGLFVAAILAASMSTISSGLNALTTAALMDFLYIKNAATGTPAVEKIRVRTARRCSALFGVIVTLLALWIGNLGTIVEATIKIGGYFGGPLLGVYLLAAFSRRANARGTLLGALIGFVAVLGIGWFTEVSFMWFSLMAATISYLAGDAISRLFPHPTADQLRLTYAGHLT